MIVKEFYGVRKDGSSLYKTYSSNGFVIQKVGTNEFYDEAIDIENSSYKYIETNFLVEKVEVEDDL